MSWLNPPNSLTILRLILTPFAVAALLMGQYRRALALFIAAGITDALDGFLARRFGWQTRFGAYADPVADKTLLTATYLALGIGGHMPVWVVGLVVGRDLVILAMVAAALLFTRVREFRPSVWGKVSTSFQVLAAAVLIINLAFPTAALRAAGAVLIWIVVFWTAWSGIDYILRGIRIALKQKA